MCLNQYLADNDNRAKFTSFLQHKFGYGQWSSPSWFIGMEEGGGNTCAEVVSRIQEWPYQHNNGHLECQPLANLMPYCDAIGAHQWQHLPQPTWEKLIRLVLLVENVPITDEAVINAQIHRLGNSASNCGNALNLLEFSPLPSPGIRTWHYEFCDFAEHLPHEAFAGGFGTRDELLQNGLGAQRCQALIDAITRSSRTLNRIVFYGRTHFAGYFQQILNHFQALPLAQVPDQANAQFQCGFLTVNNRRIPVLWVPHPARGNWPNASLVAAAQWLAN